ncbi:MAG: HEAT repeat domain-containing protein, partial [Elusimicrobiota bacterium]|nr:HEAT repeat domain-containing protein [Endomicrobiia bacterium]MDW8166807.1 HEAT repeat domain-containing protein [Elusimicrobiota bacterium]
MKNFSFIIFLFFSFSLFSQDIDTTTSKIDPFEEAVKNSQSSDPYIRRQAAEQFGVLRDLRAIPHLKRLLKDENPFVRQTSVDSLGLLRAKEVLDDILYVLINDKELQVRQSAIVALGYIGISDFKVVSPLINILKDEKESYALKYAACNTLSILRSTQAVGVLVELLETAEDINLKKSIIYTLGKISHPDGISALRDSIEKNLQNEAIIADIVKVLVEVSDVGFINKFKVFYSTPTISLKTKFYFAYALAKLAKDTS